ncbi:MAG: PilZ domain-containing protein [Boseongicola sp.]
MLAGMVQSQVHVPERRKFPRTTTELSGRYMLENGREYRCCVLSVASGGIALTGSGGSIGESVVVYIDKIGRLEGRIVRYFKGGFALELTKKSRAARDLVKRFQNPQGVRSPAYANSGVVGTLLLGVAVAGEWVSSLLDWR